MIKMSFLIITNHHENFRMYCDGFRTKLPIASADRKKSSSSILSILKKFFVGMDVSRISLPMNLYCPLTWAQRAAEHFFDCNLIRNASLMDDPIQRMELITAFLISSLTDFTSPSNQMQFHHSIVGETYEIIRPDLGFRMVCETVAFKPPTHAIYVESVDKQGKPDNIYRIYTGGCCDVIFYGKSVEVRPDAQWTIELLQRKEAYTTRNKSLKMFVGNLLRGISHTMFRVDGTLEISRHVKKSVETNGCKHIKSVVQFHGPTQGVDWLGGWNATADPVWSDGYIETDDARKPVSFFGVYTDEFNSVPTSTWEAAGGWPKLLKKHGPNGVKLPGQKQLWRKDSRCEGNPEYFMLSEFQMQFNELTPEMEKILPPTDTRFREDLRLLENGFLDEAEDAKDRIEILQQKARENRMKHFTEKPAAENDKNDRHNDPWRPLWFHLVENQYTGETQWIFNGDYYKRDWSKCPNLGFRLIENEQ